MADAVALVRAASNTAKLADMAKSAWNERTKLRADVNGQAWDLILRAQIDEIFLVLAHLGEAILPLGVFNKDYYLQTLGDVQTSLSSCGNELLTVAWEELDTDLQYCCCAGLTICAHFSPMPVYRGFGACVLSDWDWGCPDQAYLEEKARKKAIRTVYGVKQKTDPQPARSVFQAFDQVIQILQVKPMAFFVRRPPLSGFTEQPRFGVRPKKEVKNELDLLEDWLHQVIRRGHPMPAGQRITNWGIPYATWTSKSNYYILKSEKDCEALMLNQMDPGRLLHAFVCRRAASLDEHCMFLLLPRSAAESLLCWLEGLPGMSHRLVKWEDLETEPFERKISKTLRKKIGQYPIPVKYVVRDPNAATTRPGLHVSQSSPAVFEHPNTVSPPVYSPTNAPRTPAIPEAPEQPERATTMPVAELAGPERQEMPAETVDSPTKPPPHALKDRSSTACLKSIHTLRHKTSSPLQATVASTTAIAPATTRDPTGLRPSALKPRTSTTNWMVEDGPVRDSVPGSTAKQPTASELPAEVGASNIPARKPVPSVKVEPPAECAELPGAAIEGKTGEPSSGAPSTEVPKPEPLTLSRVTSNDAAITHSSPPLQSAPADNTYLELLNKVARGEISPQVLSEMLQNGGIETSTASAQPSHSASSPSTDTAESETASIQAQTSPAQRTYTLPYPESPTNAKQP